MEKERVLVANIIDIVENAIRILHPKVNKVARNCRGNTLLHGSSYYDLEDSLVEILKDAYSTKRRTSFNPSKRV